MGKGTNLCQKLYTVIPPILYPRHRIINRHTSNQLKNKKIIPNKVAGCKSYTLLKFNKV